MRNYSLQVETDGAVIEDQLRTMNMSTVKTRIQIRRLQTMLRTKMRIFRFPDVTPIHVS